MYYLPVLTPQGTIFINHNVVLNQLWISVSGKTWAIEQKIIKEVNSFAHGLGMENCTQDFSEMLRVNLNLAYKSLIGVSSRLGFECQVTYRKLVS